MQVFFGQLHSTHKAALDRQYALGSTRPLEVSVAADEVSIILSRPYNGLVAPLTKKTRLSKLFLQLAVQSSNNTRNKKGAPLSYFLYGELMCFHFVVVLQSCALPRQTFTTQGAMMDELGPKQRCRVSVVVACCSESVLREFTMRVFCLGLLLDRT